MDDIIEIDNFIERCCNAMAERYKSILKSEGKYATGELVNSIDCIAEIQGKWVIISYLVADHWKYIENGRRAGAKMPPIDAIEKWIQIKNIVPKTDGTKAPSTRQLAFVIARSIAENGIPATKAMARSIESSQSIIDDISGHLADQIQKYIDKQVQESLG